MLVMCGITSAPSPKAATCPDDTNLRANVAARCKPPSHYISALNAWSCEQHVYATALCTMFVLKKCAAGGTT